MSEVLIKIIPIILLFILGFVLKKLNFLSKENADLFLKIVFFIALPSLIFLSVLKLSLSAEFVILPFAAIFILLSTFVLAFFCGKFLKLSNQSFGTFLIGSTIMNMAFTFPFIVSALGEEALALAALFDLGNGLLVYTFVYFFAVKYGNKRDDSKAMLKKFLFSLPLWAFIMGIIFNLVSINVPEIGLNFLQLLGNLLTPLLMLSIGIYLSPKIVKVIPTIAVLLIRMLGGFVLGLIFVSVLGIDGLTKTIILIGSSAPIGLNTITFSSLENLDKEFAASLVSIAFILGVLFTPLIIILFS